MEKNNIQYHEYSDDLSTTIGRTEHLQVCTEPNDIEGLYYFKVYDRYDSSKYCRVSMTDAVCINADDEMLKLSKEYIQELINFFKQEVKSSNGKLLGLNNWEYLIKDNNINVTEDSNMHIKEGLEIPNYTRLLEEEI